MITVTRQTCARIPIDDSQFQLCFYSNNDDEKEHLALILGDVADHEQVLVRVHSECFTGDVLGSLRCDCGPQLQRALQLIAAEGAGIIIYLRQEGRGIGLLDKLKAYNLQDDGYDTVDANLMLGHQADERDYTVAALILQDLGVDKVQLLTNNPTKVASLQALGVEVVERVALQTAVTPENAAYLHTKTTRMHHLLRFPQEVKAAQAEERPFVTLSYAQSLDGSITQKRGQPMALSGAQSMRLTHALRAEHDAILVGIGTVLADDPQLTVRLVEGPHPQPVVLDSQLRFPPQAKLLHKNPHQPWVATTEAIPKAQQRRLEQAGVRIVPITANREGQVDLPALLQQLYQMGIQRLMVEGGATVITNFLAAQLVDRVVITVAPIFVGGLSAVTSLTQLNGHGLPRLVNVQHEMMGEDFVISGDVAWQ